MGSEGRAWNGAAGSGHGGGVEAKAITAAVSAAEVPRLAVSVDISLPLPEMSPDIM
jgi:ethanolamine kinase